MIGSMPAVRQSLLVETESSWSGLRDTMESKSVTMIDKAADLSEDQKLAIASLIGQRLSEQDNVSVRRLPAPPELSAERRREIADGLGPIEDEGEVAGQRHQRREGQRGLGLGWFLLRLGDGPDDQFEPDHRALGAHGLEDARVQFAELGDARLGAELDHG